MVPDEVLARTSCAPGRVLLHHVSAVSAQNDFQPKPPAIEKIILLVFAPRLNNLTRDVKFDFLNVCLRVKSWGKPQLATPPYPGESGAENS